MYADQRAPKAREEKRLAGSIVQSSVQFHADCSRCFDSIFAFIAAGCQVMLWMFAQAEDMKARRIRRMGLQRHR